jgi:hypothetical protein
MLSSLNRNSASIHGRSFLKFHFLLIFAMGWVLAGGFAAFALPATTVTLAVTSGGSTVSTVSSGSVVTLTATVLSGTTPVSPGQVQFCDAGAAHCLDIHLLATAQLTSAGTATYKLRPGGGSHSYKAVFVGTRSYAPGSSAVSALVVTGPFPTVTSIAQSNNGSSWTLTASVSGGMSTTGMSAPSGAVSFVDTSNADLVLATANLGAGAIRTDFAKLYSPGAGGTLADFNGDGILDVCCGFGGEVGDFNGDGIADLAVVSPSLNGAVMRLGNGDGTFSDLGQGPWLCMDNGQYMGCGVTVAVAGDFNGDGNEDLAVAGGGYPYVLPFYVSIVPGNGDGTFADSYWVEVHYAPGDSMFLAAGNFNGDGALELAVLHSIASPF